MTTKKIRINPLKWVFILWFYALKSVKDENSTLAISENRYGKTGEERIADIADSASMLTAGSILIALRLPTFRLTDEIDFHYVKIGLYVVFFILILIVYRLIVAEQRWKEIVVSYPVMHFAKGWTLLSFVILFIIIIGAVFFI
jgi:hypothetical protein